MLSAFIPATPMSFPCSSIQAVAHRSRLKLPSRGKAPDVHELTITDQESRGPRSLDTCRSYPKLSCCVLLSLILLADRSHAQSTPEQQKNGAPAAQSVTSADVPEISSQEQTTSFQVKVNLVEVRVVVRDKQGRAVDNLKQDDFILLDDKKPQTITRFSVERNEAIPRSQSATAPSQPGYEVHSHLAPERFLAYLFDDLHLEPGDLISARNAAISRLEFLQPSERWAVYTTSGVVQLDFTADRAKLEEALRRINSKAEARRSDCPYIPYYQADLIINQHNSDAFQAAIRDYIACYQIPSNTPAQAAAAISSASSMVQSLATQMLDKGESQTNWRSEPSTTLCTSWRLCRATERFFWYHQDSWLRRTRKWRLTSSSVPSMPKLRLVAWTHAAYTRD